MFTNWNQAKKKKSERSEWFRIQNKFDIMMAWTTPCFTAFLRCPYRIEQYLQRSNTWLLMQHIRHEQFPQANSGAILIRPSRLKKFHGQALQTPREQFLEPGEQRCLQGWNKKKCKEFDRPDWSFNRNKNICDTNSTQMLQILTVLHIVKINDPSVTSAFRVYLRKQTHVPDSTEEAYFKEAKFQRYETFKVPT